MIPVHFSLSLQAIAVVAVGEVQTQIIASPVRQALVVQAGQVPGVGGAVTEGRKIIVQSNGLVVGGNAYLVAEGFGGFVMRIKEQ